jgi:hypothetical protein
MRQLFLTLMFLAFATAAHAENRANDYLLSITPPEQAKMLGKVVGTHCLGQTVLYMGIGETGFGKDKAFWSVRCADRREFAVQVNPDGTSSVLDCATLKAMNAGTCFKKFP